MKVRPTSKTANSPIATAFRENLRMVMEERGLSQRQLAQDVGITLGFVSDILCGRNACTLDVAKRIADAVQTSLDELLTAKKTLRT